MGGYKFRVYLVDAMNANRAARMALRRIIDERPGPQATAMLLAKAALCLVENLDALEQIEAITNRAEGKGGGNG